MESNQSRRLAATLASRADEGAHVVQVASIVVRSWQDINAALGPIIGHQGVAALYRRSLHLTIATHAWLEIAEEDDGESPIVYGALTRALTSQESAAAAAAGGAMLEAFYELLVSMIGAPLTQRLLGSVWADPLKLSPAQDTSS